jgi:hypothetical protein
LYKKRPNLELLSKFKCLKDSRANQIQDIVWFLKLLDYSLIRLKEESLLWLVLPHKKLLTQTKRSNSHLLQLRNKGPSKVQHSIQGWDQVSYKAQLKKFKIMTMTLNSHSTLSFSQAFNKLLNRQRNQLDILNLLRKH